jgi:hypothetical protein
MADGTYNTLAFDALAEGVFSNSTNAQDAKAGLLKAYNLYSWDNPDEVLSSLETYAEQARTLYREQGGIENIGEAAPVSFDEIVKNSFTEETREDGTTVKVSSIDSDLGLYNKWEEENLKALESTKVPELLINKKQFKDSIQEYASAKRQETYKASREQLGTAGKFAFNVAEQFANMGLAAARPLSEALGIFTDKFDVAAIQNEIIDPEYAKSWTGQIQAGLAQGVSSVAIASSPLGVGGLMAVQGAGAVGTVYKRGRETYENTGDTGEAFAAVGIEAGSQGLQLLGEKLGFGRAGEALAKGITKPLAKEVVRSAAVEGSTEGVGQAISNVAENFQEGRPSLENVGRGVGQAAVVGAISGGVVGGIAQADANRMTPVQPVETPTNKINGTDPSTARADELSDFGAPITPVTKQNIGPTAVREVQNTDEVIDYDLKADEQGNVNVESKISEDLGTPVYELEDGSVMTRTEDNRLVRQRPDGTIEEAFDDYIYVDQSTAQDIVLSTATGNAQLGFDSDENPVLLSTDGNNTVLKKLTASPEGSEGSQIVGISRPVSPNKQEVLTQIYPIPAKIKKVVLDKSMGAAGQQVAEQQLTTFSKRLSETVQNNPDTVSPLLKELSTEGVYYDAISRSELARELEQYGDFFGLTNWFMSTPNDSLNATEITASTILANKLNDLSSKAAKTGDVETLKSLGQLSRGLLDKVGKKRAAAGQTLVAAKGLELDKVAAAASTLNTFDTALQTSSIEESQVEGDITPAEVSDPQLITQQIKTEQDAYDLSQKEAALPDAQEQELYETEIVTLEDEGQTAADEVNSQVETEVEQLETEVKEVERKAAKRKAKDIVAVEEKIVKDTQLLLEITADAQDVKDLSTDEINNLEVQRAEQLKAAEEAADAELAALVADTRTKAKEAKEVVKKSLQQRFDEAKARADKVSSDAKSAIVKLKMKQNSADDAGKADIQKRIDAIQERVIRARTRQAELQEKLDLAAAEPELDTETEALLDQLSEGVKVEQVVDGKKRRVTIKTTKTGLELGKLFNKTAKTGSGTTALLSGLNNTITGLANTFKATGKLKAEANAQIKALEAIINKNKAAVESARSAPATTKAEQKRINDARKRLENLKALPPLTAETALPKQKRVKLDAYKKRLSAVKDRQASRQTSPEQSARLKKIAELERKRKRAEAANKRATEKAVKAAKVEAVNQEAISKLDQAVAAVPPGGTKRKYEAELAARRAASKATGIPMKRLLEGMFVNNLIGNFSNLGPAAMNAAVWAPVRGAAFGLIDAYNFIKGAATGKDYRSTLLPYLAEIANSNNWKKAASLSKAILSGERVGSPIDMSDLAPQSNVIYKTTGTDRGDLLNNLQQVQETDWTRFTKAISYENLLANDTVKTKLGKTGRNLYLALSKLSGKVAGPIVRLISVLEGFNSAILSSAFQSAASAYYYNKALDSFKGEATVEQLAVLQEFQYNSTENRAKAQASAQKYADSLRDAGVKVSPARQRILEEEIFQALPSRIVQVDALKQVGLLNLNTPAQGVSGAAVQIVAAGINILQDKGALGYSARFILPFANSIGNMAGMAIELTPLGAGVKVFQNAKSFNRTAMEKDLALATSIVGSTLAGALLVALESELEKPEEERFFDIIGSDYSSSQSKRQSFKNNGGLTNSIKIGNTYIPYPETALALVLAALGSYADRKRNLGPIDPTEQVSMAGALVYAAFDSAKAASRLSMVKGLTDIYDTIQRGSRDADSAATAVARTLLNTTKPMLIPALGALRTVAKYTTNPVDGWKDLKSAAVEGLPYIQGAVGAPSLNIFGEPLKPLADQLGSGLHRIYSTTAQDLDIRWLVDRGYSIPHISDMKFDESTKELAKRYKPGMNLKDLEYDAKRAILIDAGPQMRSVVNRYRNAYGYSAKSETVQKNLSKDINRVLATSKVKYALGQLKTEDE